jgi:hypothetical protein
MQGSLETPDRSHGAGVHEIASTTRDGMTDRKPLHLKTFFLLLVIVVAGPLGNVLLGKGMKQIGRVVPWPPSTLYHQGIQVFSSGTIWLGVLSLITFFVAYMLVLSWADYSYVQPASSFSYAVNAVLCYWLLSEKISPLRWAGIAVICLGVLVVGRTSPNGIPAPEHG